MTAWAHGVRPVAGIGRAGGQRPRWAVGEPARSLAFGKTLSPRALRLSLASTAMGWALWSAPALAAPGQWRLDGQLGSGRRSGAGSGPAVGVALRRGLTEAWSAEATWAASGRWGDPRPVAWGAALGARAQLDVLRWIPFVAADAGLCQCGQRSARELADGRLGRFSYTVGFGAGAEYLLSRDWFAGFEWRASLALSSGGKADWNRWVLSMGRAWW